jgi:hypothetical protein
MEVKETCYTLIEGSSEERYTLSIDLTTISRFKYTEVAEAIQSFFNHKCKISEPELKYFESWCEYRFDERDKNTFKGKTYKELRNAIDNLNPYSIIRFSVCRSSDDIGYIITVIKENRHLKCIEV